MTTEELKALLFALDYTLCNLGCHLDANRTRQHDDFPQLTAALTVLRAMRERFGRLRGEPDKR